MPTILFVSANPTGMDRTDHDEEERTIRERLRAAKHRDLLRIETAPAARIEDVQTQLLHAEPTVVHFASHGLRSDRCGGIPAPDEPARDLLPDPDALASSVEVGGMLVLRDEEGKAVPYPAEALAELFGILRRHIPVRCVVLNACFSAEQARAIAEHVDVAIGASTALPNRAAIAWSGAFYEAIGNGKSLKLAYDLGKHAIKAKKLGDPEILHIYCREGVNPEEILLIDAAHMPIPFQESFSDDVDAQSALPYRAGSGTRLHDKQRRDVPSPVQTPATTTSVSTTNVVISAVLESQVVQLTGLMSSATESELEELRTALREGQDDRVATWIESLKTNVTRWAILAPAVKAKTLRLEASLTLRGRGDVERAKRLADEAHQIAPAEDETRLRALIARVEHGYTEAIALLEGRTDRESRELRAGLLLEVGTTDEVWTLLETGDAKESAEGSRLRAFAYLAEGKLEDAQREADRALALQPRWESTRMAAAIIGYYGALSPVALPERILPWPEPVEWRLIRRDDEAQRRLRDAAGIFVEILKHAAYAEERRQLEAWHLACLLNDPQRQDEAVVVCRHLLERDPGHDAVILWAVARHLEVNLGPSAAALAQRLDGGQLEPSATLALTSIYLSDGHADQAQAVLERTRGTFDDAKLTDLWTFWWAQSLVAGGKPEEALAFAENIGETAAADDIKLLALRAIDGGAGRAQFVECLDARFHSSGDPNYLFEACSLMAHQGAWSYVADRAEQLVQTIGTAGALHLSATSTHNAGRFIACIKLLDTHQHLLPHRQLTTELRRVHISCLEQLGDLTAAIRETEELIRKEPTLVYKWQLAGLLVATGDLKRFSLLAREIETDPNLDPPRALQVARTLSAEDRHLGIQFWHRAVALGIPDDLVVSALLLAYQLGLQDEVGELARRMQILAAEGGGGVEMREARELPEFAERWRQSGERLNTAYSHAEAPVHMVTEQANVLLVNLYRRALEENEAALDPARRPFLLMRHGGRPVWPFPNTKPERQLWLDITAVLLAAHLEILDAVERIFKPLFLPPSLLLALLDMRQKVEHHQPGRVRALERMVELVDRSALKVVDLQALPRAPDRALGEQVGEEWAALFEHARAQNGYLVVFLPVMRCDLSPEPVTLPEGSDQFLASCRSVADALKAQGALSENTYHAALGAMGASGRPDSGAEPRPGAPLFCQGNTPEMLVDAGVMDSALARFEVYVERTELERARAELHEASRGRDAGCWLDALIERLRRGIEAGTYERLPVVPPKDGEHVTDAGFAMRCLIELIQLEHDTEAVVWVDDRGVSRYTSIGSTPLVGVLEVLGALVGAGEMSAKQYFEKVTQLRAANAAFIPFTADELLHHLRWAKVEQGEVVETRELILLRQSWATCLLRSDMLQRAIPPNQPGELPFVFDSAHSVVEAIVVLWKDGGDDYAAICARADWLIREMYVETSSLASTMGLDAEDPKDLQRTAWDAARLLMRASEIDGASTDGTPSVRRRYLDWLFGRVLLRRFQAEPALVKFVAAQVKGALLQIFRAQKQEEHRAGAAYLCNGFIEDLPELLVQEIESDASFLAEIGRQVIQALSVGEWNFDSGQFWAAAAEALNGRESRIMSLEGQEIELRKSETADGGSVLTVVGASGGIATLNDPAFELLIDSPTRWEEVLRSHRSWFDVPDAIFMNAIADIATTEGPPSRMQKLRRWRKESVAAFYINLPRQLRERGSFDLDELRPPSGDALLHHHRLSPYGPAGTSFTEALDVAAATLAREEGLMSAVVCFMGLPVPLPPALLEALHMLSPQERRTLIRALIRMAGSPLSQIHLIHMLWAFRHERRAYGRLALRLSARALRKGETDAFKGFTGLLRWVNAVFAQWSDARAWTAHVRLALVWSHAHQLYAAFKAAGVPEDWLHQPFDQIDQITSNELFQHNSEYWLDVVNPRRIAWLPFILSGLAYALTSSEPSDLGAVHDLAVARGFDHPTMNGDALPNPVLMQDPTNAINGLDSFLGGNHGERLVHLVGAGHAVILSRMFLEQLIGSTLEQLCKGARGINGWRMVSLMLGDLPVYPDLAQKLEETLSTLEIVPLLKEDRHAGLHALYVASAQAARLRLEGLGPRLREQWRVAATELATQAGRDAPCEDAGRVIATLFAVAVELASIGAESDAASGELARLLDHLVNIPSLRATTSLRAIIERLCTELPPGQSLPFWPLLLKVRTEHARS